ncbi:pilus assembly protein [Rhizobium sp. TRM96647]|uniref:TadE/TadG family type IV pilus assembly protein n=1 Tax=unclassified Rhizobium TaxID=2613769 RepID=UPI0021E92C2F|nr:MULTISPECIES: TadE/TadG family type IV pilus assembly protein [unclassified Rhizobium]MCV3736356.1 pilus assembly protein [Rhizobium sp. TRM96647]MCV3758725.1 pilus assembly protein [Rhizobium sp. TRM96650]
MRARDTGRIARAMVSFMPAPLRRLARGREGAGAVEFAILVPLLLVGYIGAYELSVAMSVYNKVGRSASTISDLLTQGSSVGSDEFDSTRMAANTILAPYQVSADNLGYEIVGIQIDDDGNATVAWSRDEHDNRVTGMTKGTTVPLPENMTKTKSFIVMTTVTMDYKIELVEKVLPFLRGSSTTEILDPKLKRTGYSRLRKGNELPCSVCT